MKKLGFVTALQHFAISQDIGRGEKIGEHTYITNNPQTIRRALPVSVERIIGSLETEAILRATTVVYSTEQVNDDVIPMDYLLGKLHEVASFVNALWLFEDNNVNQEFGYVLIFDGASVREVLSNFLAVHYTTADGQQKNVELGREELRAVRLFFHRTLSLETDPFVAGTSKLDKSESRLTRALYFVQQAKTSSDLGIKIAAYCTALEALVATSQAELSHQLAERVAVFVAADSSERLSVYSRLKKAYGIRSAILHGAGLKPGAMETLGNVASDCDDLLRRSIVKIIEDGSISEHFLGGQEALDKYFLGRIFGGQEDQQ